MLWSVMKCYCDQKKSISGWGRLGRGRQKITGILSRVALSRFPSERALLRSHVQASRLIKLGICSGTSSPTLLRGIQLSRMRPDSIRPIMTPGPSASQRCLAIVPKMPFSRINIEVGIVFLAFPNPCPQGIVA